MRRALLLGLSAALLLMPLMYAQVISSQHQAQALKPLQVQGHVATTGKGTRPYDIAFYSQDGRYFYALIRDGAFSLTLPGPGRYHVTVTWAGPDHWEFGTVDMGYVDISPAQASLSLLVPSPDMPLC